MFFTDVSGVLNRFVTYIMDVLDIVSWAFTMISRDMTYRSRTDDPNVIRVRLKCIQSDIYMSAPTITHSASVDTETRNSRCPIKNLIPIRLI
jgi:hypothetical protein